MKKIKKNIYKTTGKYLKINEKIANEKHEQQIHNQLLRGKNV